MTPVPPLPAHATWHDTGTSVFCHAVRADGRWWVLRLNHFPEHPLYTLFIDAQVVGDVDDVPDGWRLRPGAALPVLTAPERAEVLALMGGLGPYGAEAGAPCAGDWCTCDLLTDEYAARLNTPPADPASP
ncbi:hypothetical protein OG311_33395 [Streptomyces sp. NBC_01343]|uniref:hypothetical protein n=1 Tax=Streptomyces sp. NBC_01343 TaxID=2903832 RepID=UPI002E1502DA|nr:hypothetical protein OG311_33395 [Streptomyces sp. NBC_01343]